MVLGHLRSRRHPRRIHGVQAHPAAVLPSLRSPASQAMSGKQRIRATLRFACATTMLVAVCEVWAKETSRPPITHISGVTILVSNLPASRQTYKQVLAPGYSCDFCED